MSAVEKKEKKEGRAPDNPSSWPKSDLAREAATYCVHSSLKFKDKDKATKQDDKGDEIDPELIPSNIISKTHWRNAQLAIFESFGMSIHQQSLKAKGADFLKWRKEYMEHTNSAGESEPFPNTRTAALRMETRKKLAAEFVTLRVSGPSTPEGDSDEELETVELTKKRKLSFSGSAVTPSASAPAQKRTAGTATPTTDDRDVLGMGLTYLRQILEKITKIEAVCAELAAETKKDKALKVREALAGLKPKPVDAADKDSKDAKDGKDSKQTKPKESGLPSLSLAAEVHAAAAKSKTKSKGKSKGKKKAEEDEEDATAMDEHDDE